MSMDLIENYLVNDNYKSCTENMFEKSLLYINYFSLFKEYTGRSDNYVPKDPV